MVATEERPARPSTVAVLSAFVRARLVRPTPWQLVAWLFASLSSLALFRMALDAGITLDEEVHVRYGEEILLVHL
jgi:hypothetical protein